MFGRRCTNCCNIYSCIPIIYGNNCAPLKIIGSPLHGIHYHSKVSSAQVKSCILLAGLYADAITKVTEPVISRNHTELMLSGFGANVICEGNTASIAPNPELFGQKIEVPGDISSAAYFIAAGLIVPGSEILIKNSYLHYSSNIFYGIITIKYH